MAKEQNRTPQFKQVCVQPPTSAKNVTLLAFAAERRAAERRAAACAAVHRYIPPVGPAAANPPHAATVEQDGTDRRTNGRTQYRYIYPAAYHASGVNKISDV